MDKLSKKNQLLIGITLFSMFFGAGNLIFPPSLGAQAGTSSILAFLGFALSAIGLPVLGVIAVAKNGGLQNLTTRAGKIFAIIFTVAIYLAIGPGLAIPRTASTSFEMAVTPFVATSRIWQRVLYSLIFFAVAFLVAMHPSKIRDWLGKRLMPMLLVLIAVLFVGCLFIGKTVTIEPQAEYASSALSHSFLDGYQTMDAIAALIFGMIIAMNIRDIGVKKEKSVIRSLIFAGLIAGIMFLIVYGALTFMGVKTASAGLVEATANGATILSSMAKEMFGTAGQVIIALIFVIACLNTCIGLICCCATYFNKLMPKLSYKVWAVIFALISALIANVGLDSILKISVPILSCLYPVAITFIALGFLSKKLSENTFVFPIGAITSAIFGIITTLVDSEVAFAVKIFGWMPLSAQGLSWILPTAIACIIGLLIKRKNKPEMIIATE